MKVHQLSPTFTAAILLALTSLASAGETLYNGIVLPNQWPPKYDRLTREPMPAPYLKNPPAVIPIDIGRQLFVDDFLIETTTMTRTCHQADYYAQNPVLAPGTACEHTGGNWFAAPYESLMLGQFSIWQEPTNNDCGVLMVPKRCDILLGFSRDGFHWDRPDRNRFIACTCSPFLYPRNCLFVIIDLLEQ